MTCDVNRERREAIAAGRRALESLKSAQGHLNDARFFGFYDLMGGNVLSTYLKHSKMDKAKADMEQAKDDLKKFSQELQDTSFQGDLNIETRDFLAFADWFFDGFYVDWMMQERINKARDQVSEAIRRVESILQQMER